MALVEYPMSIIPNSMSLNLRANTKTFTSSFNNSRLTSKFPGKHWVASLSFSNLYPRELAELKAFLWALDGSSGRFYLPLFDNTGSPAKGTPVALGTDQTGGFLLTNGWSPSSIVLNVGDYFEINNELKMVTSTVSSSSTGQATIAFTPWLRTAAQTGDAITTLNPKGMFMLTDDSQGEIDFDPGFGSVSIDIVEAFYV